MNADRVLLVVVLDYSDDDNEEKTHKVRVRERDLSEFSSESTVSGKQLRAILLEQAGMDAATNTTATIDIFNPTLEAFETLNPEETDVVGRFGKCIRCTISFSNASPTPPRAIMGRYFPYDSTRGMEISDTRIHVQETPNIVGAGTGLNIWDGAMLLARYLELYPELVKGKRVLELGAGTGLVGIAAGIFGAREVVLTDLPYCLPLMQENVHRHHEAAAERGCRRMECTICDWYDPPALCEFGGTEDDEAWSADVILVADCVWVQELVQPLVNTLEQLLAEADHPVQVILSYQQRGKDTHEAFLTGIQSIFNDVREVNASLTNPECFHLFKCSKTLEC